MKKYREDIAKLIASAAGGEPDDYIKLIQAPPKPEMGDYALPCFPLAKTLKKDPKKIAEDLAGGIDLAGTPFSAATAAGPYLNFRIDDTALARDTLTEIHDRAEDFGRSDVGAGRTVVIDYSSPNIAKPFHIGHLRSTVIGAALYRINKALGYDPVGINHLGDWGTQFGMVMAAFDEDQDHEELARNPIAYSLKLYVDYNRRSEEDPAALDMAKDWFRRLEDGDRSATDNWRRFRDLSLSAFERVYQRLSIRFDHYTGESFYNDRMEDALDRVEAAGALTREEDGAEMVRLDDFDMPPLILRKSDGATLYATREVAAAIYRWETFSPERILYVVGTPQELHFRQLIQTLKLMGLDWADRIVHVKFGHVHGMSTRRGEVVLLEDVLDEAAHKAREKIDENVAAGKLDPAADRDELAEAVGIGAIIANDLKHRRERDIHFDWDQVLHFEGETGPYLQYSYARIMGIIGKAGSSPRPGADFSLLIEPSTRLLVRKLADYPDALLRAGEDHEPSLVATYLFELTKAFNHFYAEHRVIGAGDELEAARLLLVRCAGQVIENALTILGVPALERM